MDTEQRQRKAIPKTQAGTAKKLRSACDFCHQTKVKCSGGNPCNGCSQLSIDCVYSASNRIGRPKGSRNKKTIERVKRYKAENEERQKAQLAAEQAEAEAEATLKSQPRSQQNSCSSASSASSASSEEQDAAAATAMTIDWTAPAPSPLDIKINKSDVETGTNDLFPFSCETDAGVVPPVDPVYSLYTDPLDHDLPDFDFGQNPTDHSSLAEPLLAPIFPDVDGPQFHPFLDTEQSKAVTRLDTSLPSPPSSSHIFSAVEPHRALSVTSAAFPSTPLTSPHDTPTLTSSSSVASGPSSTCTCLQDQASLLSRLASTSLNSAPLALDAVLECAQQAIRTWDTFLRCRYCSYRLFESKFDSYLVLTSSMRIILNILNDQMRHIDQPSIEQSSEGSPSQDGRSTSPAASTASSLPRSRRESRSWMLGMYEPSGFENQLISATLLSKIAGSVVRISQKLVDITSGTSTEPFLLDIPANPVPAGPNDPSASIELPSKENTGRSYLIDHDMDDSAMGFNLKFLQHKTLSNDRSARRFKEEISARMRQLV